MTDDDGVRASTLWARLRFQIVGPLLAAPPESGELRVQLEELAARTWRHPTTGESVRFGVSTLERWYYIARNEPRDPVKALERRVRKGAGTQSSIGAELAQAIELSYRQHPRWSYQLHYDNLRVLVERDASLGELPSYTTVSRFMKSRGLVKQKRRRRRGSEPEPVARERRLYEVSHVNAMWHFDFHECSRAVVTKEAKWLKPWLLGILDDRSRLACHVQWYFVENAENLVHGFSQGIQKRGVPRSTLSDNGAAMMAGETRQGFESLGITHWTTLPATPEQNGKQECFWGQVEGRLIAMLEGVKELTLERLNQATQAWVELEYNRKRHSEIGESPYECFLREPNVGRPSPSSEELRRAFRIETRRKQRRSDGTISVAGRRFELPSRYRTLAHPTIRYARWDLSQLDLVDPVTGNVLCALYPVDKRRNAAGRRTALEPVVTTYELRPPAPSGVAPLLEKLMADYAATGLPPAYLPTTPSNDADEENDDE